MWNTWTKRSQYIIIAGALLLPAAALAHAEWFLAGPPAPDSSLPGIFWFAAVLAAVIFFVLRPLAAKPVSGTAVKVLHLQVMPFVGLAKNVWSLGLGIMLLVFAVRGEFFSPGYVATEPMDEYIRMLFVFAGLGFTVLYFKRYAAVLLLAALALFWIRFGTLAVLLHTEYLGLGLAFLFAYSQGKFSVRYAMRYARIGLGVALVTAALHEKIFSPGISLAFLADHSWNFLAAFNVSDMVFISLTAVVEIFLGVLLIMNVFPRFAALAVLCAFFTTYLLLGATEFIGHAIPGMMALFIAIYGTDYYHFTEEQEIEL